MELAGMPLAWHAVAKLRQVCMDVHVLSDRLEMDAFAPLVQDVRTGCGPMGGMEAALLHTCHEWSLFLPVDMPFVPAGLLDWWIRDTLPDTEEGLRLSMFETEGRPQPTLCLLHGEVLPFLSEALDRGEFKLFPVLKRAGEELARRQGVTSGRVLRTLLWTADGKPPIDLASGGARLPIMESEQRSAHLWFANLNTPEEFAEAEKTLASLDH